MPGSGAPATDVTSSFGPVPAGSSGSRGVPRGPLRQARCSPPTACPPMAPTLLQDPRAGSPNHAETLPSQHFPPRDPHAPPPRLPGPGRCPATLSAGGWIRPSALSPGTPTTFLVAPNSALAPCGVPGFRETRFRFWVRPSGTQPSTHRPPATPSAHQLLPPPRLQCVLSRLHPPPCAPTVALRTYRVPWLHTCSSAPHTPPHHGTQRPSKASRGPPSM